MTNSNKSDNNKSSSRQNRLKDNLRENLQKRKGQARARTVLSDNQDETNKKTKTTKDEHRD